MWASTPTNNTVGDDAHIVPKPYGLIAEKYIRNVPEIEKYVLMPDHIHMIVRLNNGSMWASTPTVENAGTDAHISPQTYINEQQRMGVMELPQRKPNRLSDYDYNQNGAYFVTICTKYRKRILSQIVGDDAHIVPKPYGLIAEKYIRNVPEIKKYVLMPDHIHMIVRLNNGSMWASTPTVENAGTDAHIHPKNKVASIVRSIKTLTTKEIGWSIFQRSYYDHVIRNQQDYDEIWEYIENNPRKWVIQKQGYE